MLNTVNIYRHFKGGYYIVHSQATVESTGEQVVIYQSLQDGRVWTRPLFEFMSPVPGDKENPTGQAHRFERITDFSNQLSAVPTAVLVKELLNRIDCPTEIQTAVDSNKVWREQYLLGRYEEQFITEDNIVEDFNIETVHTTLEEAVSRRERLCNPKLQILKEVFIKVDFDESPLM